MIAIVDCESAFEGHILRKEIVVKIMLAFKKADGDLNYVSKHAVTFCN